MTENPGKLFDISNRVAIVTGSARGIGKEIASAFAEAGAHVVIADIEERLAQDVSSCLNKAGCSTIACRVDVSNEEDVMAMVKITVDTFGRVDILVNNAAKGGGGAPPEDLKLSDWTRVMAVNMTSVFLCCREVGKEMIRQKGGSIINIASIEAIVARAYKDEVAYGSSKAAVVLLTKELAKCWAKHNIRVNAIAPGYAETPFSNLASDAKKSAVIAERSPFRRAARVDEFNGPSLFLASKASSYVTGHVLVVDGGFTIV